MLVKMILARFALTDNDVEKLVERFRCLYRKTGR